ncbi:Protein of unknown function (DUF4448) domain containing protein [Naviculisporaceae sp. PSN 640]
MRSPTTPRQVAVLLFHLTPLALSLPEARPHPAPQVVNGPGGGGPGRGNAPAPVLPWVSVDATGDATTITPSVFTTDGMRTTVNAPPSALTSTATYTLSPGGTDRPDLASTYTGLAPVASATGTSDAAGSFLACNRGQGLDEPFCLPKRGSTLHPGRTYYITWTTSYFAPPNISIALQAQYNPSGTGFTTLFFPASVGFFAWEIPEDFLTSSSGATLSSLNVTLSLVYEDTETANPEDLKSLPGPEILIAPELDERHDDDDGGDKSYTAAIAVPIIVVILLVGFGGFCLFKRKRQGAWPVIGGVIGRRKSASGGGGGGYGERQSRSQRVGSGGVIGGGTPFDGSSDKQGIQLTDRDSWSPTAASAPGRNVFREEIRRQESQR